MSVEQGLYNGFVHTEIRMHIGTSYCHFWTADETGKLSKTTVVMSASDCRNVAAMLIGHAEELDELPRTEGTCCCVACDNK